MTMKGTISFIRRIYKVTLYEHLFVPVVQASSDLSFTLATIIDATVLW